MAHKGTELVAVASGLVQVVLANGRPVLRRGKVLLVETTTIERWRNLGAAEATCFGSFATSRGHLRAAGRAGSPRRSGAQ
jgi:hypothetical protein